MENNLIEHFDCLLLGTRHLPPSEQVVAYEIISAALSSAADMLIEMCDAALAR